MKTTLYNLTEQVIQIDNMVMEAFEERGFLSDEERKRIDDWILEIRDASHEKLEGYAHIILEMVARKKAIADEVKRLRLKQTATENAIDLLKDRVKNFMEVAELTKIKAGISVFTICKNGGKTPLLIDVMPEAMPEAYHIKTISIDSDMVRQDLEDGKAIDGARLGERGTHVRVR